MRPAPIPDELIWPGTQRMVFTAPDGDMTGPIRPVEACVNHLPSGSRMIAVRCIPEEGDLEKLARGGAVWITFLDELVPFDVTVTD